MSLLKKIGIAFGAIFIVGVIMIAASLQHWWLRTAGSAVFVNNEYSPHAIVFRNHDGDFLITADGRNIGTDYIYYPSSKEIGVPNGGQFIFLGFCAYGKDVPVPVVLSSNRIKIEEDMRIVEQNEWVKFTGMNGSRIRPFRSNL